MSNEMTDAEKLTQACIKWLRGDNNGAMSILGRYPTLIDCAIILAGVSGELAARNAQIERVEGLKGKLFSQGDEELLDKALAYPEPQSPAERNLLDALEACNQQVQRALKFLDDEERDGKTLVSISAVRKALARPESQQPAMKCSCGHLESLHFVLKPKRPCAAYGCGCVGFEDALTATITPPAMRCQQISIGRQCKLEPEHKQDHEFAPLAPSVADDIGEAQEGHCDVLLADGFLCRVTRNRHQYQDKNHAFHTAQPREIDNGDAQSKARASVTEARNELSDAFRVALADYVGWWLDNNSRLKSAKASNSIERFLDAILAAAREGVK